MVRFLVEFLFIRDALYLKSFLQQQQVIAQEKNCTLINALVISEDKRFFQHKGADFFAIVRAIYLKLLFGKNSGASTITQQLVRTITNYRDRTISRKLKEICLAMYIETFFCKKDIASMYIDVAYFGWKMNGVNQAINRLTVEKLFLDKNINIVLIAMLKYPLPKIISDNRKQQVLLRIQYIENRMRNDKSEAFK